jgi:ferrous iron transport protein A
VTQVNARGAIRQRLLDMGMLPESRVEIERVAPAGEPIWLRLHGTQLALRRGEAEAVVVVEG